MAQCRELSMIEVGTLDNLMMFISQSETLIIYIVTHSEMLVEIACTVSMIFLSLFVYYQHFIRTHLKAIQFSYDSIPNTLNNAVVYISDPHSCFWCLR